MAHRKATVALATLLRKFHRSVVRNSCSSRIPALEPEENKMQLTAHWVSGRTPRHLGWSCWWRSGSDEVPAASTSHRASLWWSRLGCYGPAACMYNEKPRLDPKFMIYSLQKEACLAACNLWHIPNVPRYLALVLIRRTARFMQFTWNITK